MDSEPSGLLRREQARYLDALVPPRDRASTSPAGGAAGEPHTGRLLELLARAVAPRRILHLGAGRGDLTLRAARGAPEARIVAVEPDAAERERLSRTLAQEVGERVELLGATPLEALATLPPPFELAVVEGAASELRRTLDHLLPALTVGGLVFLTGLLAGGRVAERGDEDDPDLDALETFNPYLMIHPQLVSTLLPIGDGVGLASKIRPLLTEVGGPF